jgi:small subunit ribosomal protein S20
MPHIPVHPSAQKRHRQNLKRAVQNRLVKTRARSAAKAAQLAIEGTDETKARADLKLATKVLHKAASSGTMHRNTASRKVARLAKSLHRKFAKSST